MRVNTKARLLTSDEQMAFYDKKEEVKRIKQEKKENDEREAKGSPKKATKKALPKFSSSSTFQTRGNGVKRKDMRTCGEKDLKKVSEN